MTEFQGLLSQFQERSETFHDGFVGAFSDTLHDGFVGAFSDQTDPMGGAL